jgi:hypothetical protein
MLKMEKQVDITSYTSLKIGAKASYFAIISSEAELAEAYQWAKTHKLGIFVLGGGSNILISKPLKALVLKNELKELTFSNEEINYISSLTRFHMRGIGTPKATSKLLKKLKENDINYNDFLKLKVADCHANTFKEDYTKNEILKFHEKIKNAFNHGLPKDLCELAIKGNDIMNVMNIPQGKEVGEIKQKLLDIVNDSPRLNNKKDLLKLLERIKDGKDE